MKAFISGLCITGFLLLAGCGQKGDLYLDETAPPPEMEQPADNK